MVLTDRSIANPAQPVNRIVFTGDHLRLEGGGRTSATLETRWLANLLEYQISLTCPDAGSPPPIEVQIWDDPDPSHFSGDKFYALNGMTPCLGDWARLVDATEITDAAAEYLRQALEGSVVIGHNFTNWQLRFLNAAGIPYLDFLLHPARFMDDIFFAVRTNVPAMHNVLRTYACPEEMIRLQAAIHRASLLRGAPRDIPENSGLFAAQQGVDKSLVEGGRFQEIEDYREGIAAFVERHPYIYVKPHPYARLTAPVIAFLRALAGDSDRVRVVHDNIYSLVVEKNISEVCGISSCAIYEAEYFGKNVTYLSPARPMLYGSSDEPTDAFKCDPFKYVAIYDAFFNPTFWAKLLAPVMNVRACPDLQLAPKTNRLRNNLHVYWGYSYLDWEVPLRSIGIHPPPPATATPARESHQQGLRLYLQGSFNDAVECFAAAVVEEPTAERWNDWGVAQLARGRKREAADGFRIALALDPGDQMARENLEAMSRDSNGAAELQLCGPSE